MTLFRLGGSEIGNSGINVVVLFCQEELLCQRKQLLLTNVESALKE